MKKFPMAISNDLLYEMFMQFFNVISSNFDLTKKEYDNIEKDYLKYLLFEYKVKENTGKIFDDISELLTLYRLYQQYTNFDEIMNEITDLMSALLQLYPQKAPKFPKNTSGQYKESKI